MAGTLRWLQMLDRFRLVWDGATVDVPPHSAILVAHLAILDRPVHRSLVAGTLSPVLSERRALAALRSALYRIRVPAVRAEGELLRLAPDVSVDFREAIALARSLTRTSTMPERIDTAIELLGRELLPHDDAVWIEAERQRFRHLRLCALSALATGLTDEGRYAEAVEVAQLASMTEPASEAAEATLIRALVAEGNAALAMREYRSFRRRLWRDLRVRPTRDFDQLLQNHNGDDPVTHPRRVDDVTAISP
jgi:DNA-binding SARP family transcriptional activator